MDILIPWFGSSHGLVYILETFKFYNIHSWQTISYNNYVATQLQKMETMT
jgi:hypothetical protein